MGLSLSVAVTGTLAAAPPGPLGAALLAIAWAGAATFLVLGTWPPLTGEAVRRAVPLALPAAAWLLVPLRNEPFLERAGIATWALAGASLLLAEGSRANAEAGWRRAVGWAVGIGGCVALIAGGTELLRRLPANRKGLGVALAVAAALVAWLPAGVVEWRRTARELSEEVALGLIPAEDAAVLAVPWKRAREARFGRADERREYVRSALLLAVVRRQQRRRTGEASRLRQLELLAFRTRVRRTLDARATRYSSASSDEIPLPSRES